MVPRLEDFVPVVGDSAAERKLARTLREQPAEDRLRFIQGLIAVKQPKCLRTGLRLVKSCVQDRRSLLQLLDQGLREADASVVADWLEAVVSGLGFKRVVGVLADRVGTDPESVVKARYWLPRWVPDNDPSAVEAVHALDRLIADKVQGDARLQSLFHAVQGR